MKKLLFILLIVLVGCAPLDAPCTCYRVNYHQHNDVDFQELFRYPVANDSCANWLYGNEYKTDSNGYLYNYKCE